MMGLVIVIVVVMFLRLNPTGDMPGAFIVKGKKEVDVVERVHEGFCVGSEYKTLPLLFVCVVVKRRRRKRRT